MQPQSRQLDSFWIVGIARRQSNLHPEASGKHWQELFAGGGVQQISNRRNDELYALYTDYDGDYTQPAARYAVFDASGPQPASVTAVWQHIWQAPLPRAYSCDFDHYRADDRVEVHVAVR